MRFWQEE
jgi:hypothetical protein